VSSETQDLNWLAFRYVAGELSAEEEQRFEERLALDQSAREAVEEAVKLIDALHVAAADLPGIAASVPASAPRIRRIALAGSVATAVLIGGLVWLAWTQGMLSRSPSNVPIAETHSENRSQRGENSAGIDGDHLLALTWAKVHNTPADLEAASELPDDSLWSEDPFDMTSETATEESHGVPEWLMTAVSNRSMNRKRNK